MSAPSHPHPARRLAAAAATLALAACTDAAPTAPSAGPSTNTAAAADGRFTLEVTPAETTLVVGQTASLQAFVIRAGGDTLRDRTAWSALDPAIASVRNAGGRGLVTALAVGDARIVANAGVVQREVLVHVVPAAPSVTARLVVARLDVDAMAAATDLWAVDPDGATAPRRLTGSPHWDESPAVAPGGARVAFARRAVSGIYDARLWVVNADGTGLRPLFDPATRDALPGEDIDPSWSPDGRTLAFASNRDGLGYRLYLANADGTNVRPVGTASTLTWQSFGTPSWSPDGTQLLAAVTHGATSPGQPAIARIALTAGTAQLLAGATGVRVAAPAWSPDGQHALYVDQAAGSSQLWRVALGTGEAVRLVASDARDYQPRWAPGGQQIAFLRQAGSGYAQLWMAEADGTGARAVTTDAQHVIFAFDWR